MTAFFLQAFLRLLVYAAAGAPFIAALSLVIGRRGSANFCVAASALYLRPAFILGFLGPFYFVGDYLAQILPILAPESSLWAPLFTPPGFPWLTAALSWLCGLVCVGFACSRLRALSAFPDDKYALREVRAPFSLCLVAAAFYCASWWLQSWPFAGFPQGLPEDRVVMAVARHAMRLTFATLSPAAAIGLLYATLVFAPKGKEERASIRWLAFWAIAGLLPQTVQDSGFSVGVLLGRSSQAVAPLGIAAQGLAALLAWGAIFAWVALFPGERTRRAFVWIGCAFLLARAWAPALAKLAGF